jgi:hypothetical protein
MRGCELDACDSGENQVEGSCECSNEPSVSTKGGETRNQLFGCWLVNGDFCPRSCCPVLTCHIVGRVVFPVSKGYFCCNRPYRYLLFTQSVLSSVVFNVPSFSAFFSSAICVCFIVLYFYEFFVQCSLNETKPGRSSSVACPKPVGRFCY